MSNTLEPRELALSLSKIISMGEDMRGHLLAQARDAAESGETGWLVQVSGDAKDVEDCISRIKACGERLGEILTHTLGFEDEPTDAANSTSVGEFGKQLRRLRSQITQGEINQNLLTLAAHRKRGLIRSGEHFRIRLPDGEEFETDFVQTGNKLRERGRIGAFYRQQAIAAGDYILLEEIEPNLWTLTKAPSSERSTLHATIQNQR